MVVLNTEQINAKAPYTVTFDEKSQGYKFITDCDIEYAVAFDDDFLLESAKAYQFVIANPGHKRSPLDKKLRDTIVAILLEFFEEYQHPILYLCDTGDSKQRMRDRLFKIWFQSTPLRTKFVFYSGCVTDIDGIENYAAIIVSIDHPKVVEITQEFTSALKYLQAKP